MADILLPSQWGPQVMPAADQGAEFPWEQSDAILIDLTAVAFEWYMNMTPLLSRLAQRRARQVQFNMVGHAIRPNQVLLMASISNSATTLTVQDSSFFMNGDVLELSTGEHVEVAADPDTVANTLTVVRGVEGTTAQAITVTTGSEPVCYLLSNSRTGGERWQHGIFPKTWADVNWCQTSQHPVEVSGLLQDTEAFLNEDMAPTPLDFNRQRQLDNMMFGYERAFLYGLGEAPTTSSSKRAKTKGILKRLSEVNNVHFQPTGYAAYTPDMLTRDLYSQVNGNPDILMLSTDFRQALGIWKMPLIRADMGTTEFNQVIETFVIPSFGPQAVIFNPQLRKGTALALRLADLIIRFMRLPTWWVRGKAGDTWEGDIVARMGIQINNPELQTAVTGVTGFAAG